MPVILFTDFSNKHNNVWYVFPHFQTSSFDTYKFVVSQEPQSTLKTQRALLLA